jgi:hypothetical protein
LPPIQARHSASSATPANAHRSRYAKRRCKKKPLRRPSDLVSGGLRKSRPTACLQGDLKLFANSPNNSFTLADRAHPRHPGPSPSRKEGRLTGEYFLDQGRQDWYNGKRTCFSRLYLCLVGMKCDTVTWAPIGELHYNRRAEKNNRERKRPTTVRACVISDA